MSKHVCYDYYKGHLVISKILHTDGNVLIFECDKIDDKKPKAVLSFKEQITCIIRLSWGANGLDFIGIGSGNSIQVYNAYENVSQFYKKLDYSITTLTAGFVSV